MYNQAHHLFILPFLRLDVLAIERCAPSFSSIPAPVYKRP